jgi:hypothetical protein
MTGQRATQSGLAGTIGAHDGMDFASTDGERKSFEDRMVTDGDVKIIDDEHLTYRIFEFKGE